MKKMSIFLIIIGVIFIIAGITIYVRDKAKTTNSDPVVNSISQKTYSDTNTSSDPKEIGNRFENFVANIFANNSFFSVLEWNQGVTSTEGVYPENVKNPDFLIKQNFKNSSLKYWVECKYRSSKNGSFKIADYQLSRYRGIQKDSKVKIFVAVGTGGNPDIPNSFYVIPLDSINSEIINLDDIKNFLVEPNATSFKNYIESYFLNKVFKK